MGSRLRRRLLVVMLAIGVGLVVAPLAFQMFTRAPKGGRMIDEFRPYMTTAEIGQFQGFLHEIDDAHREAADRLPAADQRYASVAEWQRRWPAIDADMSDMLATMERNIGRYEGVDALPPFVLFPWFFVLPGLLVAGIAGWGLSRAREGDVPRHHLRALAVLGVALIAAPAVFQMFTRAPGGARMIEDFAPLMTTRKVTTIQGYFLTIGAAEGQLRTEVLPAQPTTEAFPAIGAFSRDWPRISSEMAPMIGTMADNVDNFAAVRALPPFWLFPWFFVLPGLLVAGLALAGARRDRHASVASAPVTPVPDKDMVGRSVR